MPLFTNENYISIKRGLFVSIGTSAINEKTCLEIQEILLDVLCDLL